MTEEIEEITEDSPTEFEAEERPGRVIQVPETGLIVLVGASGCGKSTFARKHFKPTEILSSDTLRGWVCDDELDQSSTTDAFDLLHYIAKIRLKRGKLVVVDATNVQFDARKALLQLAETENVLCTAIVFKVPARLCQERNALRTDRQVPKHAISRQCDELRRTGRGIGREGFHNSYILSAFEMETATVERTRLWTDKRDDHGPFDIIGDIHGCVFELKELLQQLGYEQETANVYRHPLGRRAFFVGDLVDRGPGVVETLDIARRMVNAGTALAVPGNHDEKLMRWLRGRKVSLTHGLQQTIEEIEAIPADVQRDWKEKTSRFLNNLVSHYVLDDGKLVVAHAGLIEALQGRASGRVRSFCIYGDTTGETDEKGLPVRRDWAADYRGKATVVYGHTPQAEPVWVNNTINIDTGCVFGGSLTALRWPERELISVQSQRTYAESPREFLPSKDIVTTTSQSGKSQFDLMLSDVVEEATVGSNIPTFGANRRVETALAGQVTIAAENGAAALELMSRFAVDPRWLVYLPPTMSPCETEPTGEPYLEHPRGAFAYYQREGISNVICEEKHMGSRAVIVICRNEDVATRRFGISGIGECYTRTGRRFFDEPVRTEFLSRVRLALDISGFWETHKSEWAVIDSEIMPWNAKAQGLLREQYAPVGAAAKSSLDELERVIREAEERGISVKSSGIAERTAAIDGYIHAYRAYCWHVDGLQGIQVAPFHLLATEGTVHAAQDHVWHLNALAGLHEADSVLFRKTDYLEVDVNNDESVAGGIEWWLNITAASAEGMVVKPREFIARGESGIVQPAVKCRGREYLRIIYGPEYALPENLENLRRRGLGRKRSLARREFALGMEGLTRFVALEPLHRVHECAFAVLALESEPVDPRL